MKEVLIKNKYFIILWIVCIVALITSLGHYSGILIDFGREVYYPERILQGDVLYKDLFNIYGPLAYQINAVLYKIFGAKLSTLYGAGAVCSILTVSGVYLLANRYLSKFLSFSLGLFTIAVGVTTTSIFNFHFPYSWAVLYGLIAFIYSLYFIKDKLWLSALLAGVCITCKYDFLLYGFVILFLIFRQKDWKALLYFVSVPILSFGILFAQGLQISDLVNSLVIVKNMAKSKTLTYFYQNSGIYFHPKALLMDLVLFLKFAVPFGGILLGTWKNKKIITIISFILAIWFFDAKVMFGFLPILLFIAIWFKNWNLLTVSVFLTSVKVFWVLIMGSYGTYYVSILLVAVFSILFKYIPKKFEKVTAIYILMLSFLIWLCNVKLPESKIVTPKGNISTFSNTAYQSKSLINFINKNTNPADKIVIFPEGMIINFLTDRQSDGFYNSMLPLYVETFGEDKIIEHFNENKPEYIIFNNLNMKDYYFEYICKDYALDFCAFVKDNYNYIEPAKITAGYVIFKRK